ncbi:MAG: ArsA family ATPase [Gemmatimonadales bacterium]
MLDSLLSRSILFFGGKGGVGKTTVASAVGLRSASLGRKTLLVSTDPAHSTSDILQADLGPDPRPVRADFWAMEIDPSEETERYIDGVKRRISDSVAPRLVEEVERQIDIARVSPGAEEAALFERFARLIESERREFDTILFDTAPTGQTLRLLSLPELMSVWISGLISRRKKVNVLGRMWRNVAGAAAGDAPEPGKDAVIATLEERKARFHRVRQLVTDPEQTAFVFVLVPERLPILETAKAVRALEKYRIPVGAIVVNRVLPDDADGDFLAKRRVQEAEYLVQIDRMLSGYPIYHVPLHEKDVVGMDSLLRLVAVDHVVHRTSQDV